MSTVLVIGAGAGIGATTAARFAAAGYTAVLVRRSDRAGLDAAVAKIRTTGGAAHGVILNAVEPNGLEELVVRVERDFGPVEVALYNLGAQIGNRSLAETAGAAPSARVVRCTPLTSPPPPTVAGPLRV